MKKLELSHTVLYAKGWYRRSGNLIADLKKTLKYDGYYPKTRENVVNIIVARLTEIDKKNFTGATFVQNVYRQQSLLNVLEEDYIFEKAIINYCLSVMVGLKDGEWEVKLPSVTILPVCNEIPVDIET